MREFTITVEINEAIERGLQHAMEVLEVGVVSNDHRNVSRGLYKACYFEAAKWISANPDLWYAMLKHGYEVEK